MYLKLKRDQVTRTDTRKDLDPEKEVNLDKAVNESGDEEIDQRTDES
jgi:hypothetical protein